MTFDFSPKGAPRQLTAIAWALLSTSIGGFRATKTTEDNGAQPLFFSLPRRRPQKKSLFDKYCTFIQQRRGPLHTALFFVEPEDTE